jgi:hypothetical protein
MSSTNFLKTIFLTLCIAFAVPAISFSAVPADSSANAREYTKLVNRVYEIQSMDKTNLSSSEKKALKKELKELKTQAAEGSSRGVYLSVGAIIIIILLLILIL